MVNVDAIDNADKGVDRTVGRSLRIAKTLGAPGRGAFMEIHDRRVADEALRLSGREIEDMSVVFRAEYDPLADNVEDALKAALSVLRGSRRARFIDHGRMGR